MNAIRQVPRSASFRASLTVAVALLVVQLPQGRAQTTSIWVGPGLANWSDAANWEHSPPTSAFPNSDTGVYNVLLDRASVTLDRNIEIESLVLGVDAAEGGLVTGAKSLVVQSDVQVGRLGSLFGPESSPTVGALRVDIRGTLGIRGALLMDFARLTTSGLVTIGTGTSAAELRLLRTNVDFMGGVELRNDSSILDYEIPPVTPLDLSSIVAVGSFQKTSGNGTSIVEKPLEMSNGVIGSESGTLDFRSGGRLSSSAIHASGGNVSFSRIGPDIENGLRYRGLNGGRLSFEGIVNLDGAIISEASDMTRSSIVFRGKEFSGGALELVPNHAFTHQAGDMGARRLVTNRGAYRWQGGRIAGSGVTNTNVTPSEFVIETELSKAIVGATLTNNGTITHTSSRVNLGPGGRILNEQEDSVYKLDRATISASGADTRTEFRNSSVIEATGTSLIQAPLFSEGTIEVANGDLQLTGPVDIKSNVILNQSKGPAILTIGGESSTVSIAQDLTLSFTGGNDPSSAIARWASGSHQVVGDFTGSGVGELQVSGSGVQWTVPTDRNVQLEFSDTSPFVLQADPQSSSITIDGNLTNLGKTEWRQGVVGGQGTFTNGRDDISMLDGLLVVTGPAEISDGNHGSLINRGFVEIRSAADRGFVLNSRGTIVNEAGGMIDLLGNGGIFAGDNADFATISVTNHGVFGKLDGSSSDIFVPFVQSSNAFIDVESGSLRFVGPAEIAGNVFLQSVAEKPAPSVELIGTSHTADVAMTFRRGSYEILSGQPKLSGKITGVGSDGALKLRAPSVEIDGETTLDFKGNHVQVEHKAGRLNGPGALVNLGNYTISAGTIAVPLANQGVFTMAGGRLEAMFRNAAPDGEGQPLVTVSNGTLGANVQLHNEGVVTIRRTSATDGRLELETGAVIQNNGTLELAAGASIARGTVAGLTPRLENSGRLRVSEPSFSDARVESALFNFGGTIEVDGDAFLRVDDAEQLLGGKIVVGLRGSAVFNANALGLRLIDSLHYELADGATVSHTSTVPKWPIVRGMLTGTGTGAVDFVRADVRPLETAVFNFQGITATCRNCNILGTAENRGTLTLAGESDLLGDNLKGGKIANLQGAELHLVGFSGERFVGPPPEVLQGDYANILNQGELSVDRGGTANLSIEFTNIRNGTNGTVHVTPGMSAVSGSGTIENDGTFASDVGSNGVLNVTKAFNNRGSVAVRSGRLILTDLKQFNSATGELTGGKYSVGAGAALVIGNNKIRRNLADVKLEGASARFASIGDLARNDGQLSIFGGASYASQSDRLENSARVSLSGNGSSISINGDYSQAASNSASNAPPSTSILDGANWTSSSLVVDDGDINVFDSSVSTTNRFETAPNSTLRTNNSTIESPSPSLRGITTVGSSPGQLTIVGNATIDGLLQIELGGPLPGLDHDAISVSGSSTLHGIIRIQNLDSYAPTIGETFDIVTGDEIVDAGYSLAQLDGPLLKSSVVSRPDDTAILQLRTIEGVTLREGNGRWDTASDWSDSQLPSITSNIQLRALNEAPAQFAGPTMDTEIESLVIGDRPTGNVGEALFVVGEGAIRVHRGLTIRSDGVFVGGGDVVGDVYSAGTVAIGDTISSARSLDINGDFVSAGRLSVGLAVGDGSPQDLLSVSGIARLLDDSQIIPILPLGQQIQVGDAFLIAQAAKVLLDTTMIDRPSALPSFLSLRAEVVVLPSGLEGLQLRAVLAGDYNDDGHVDAADFTVWKDSFGSRSNLAADGNGSGEIDAADYTVWKDNFGTSVGQSSILTVPEPNCLPLVVVIGFALFRSSGGFAARRDVCRHR
ncbi:MAG: hypothetical protein R3E01_27715 [Pirellulaceae bacterium]|nr:hypothetical protein [Planctomycetales bacterium]